MVRVVERQRAEMLVVRRSRCSGLGTMLVLLLALAWCLLLRGAVAQTTLGTRGDLWGSSHWRQAWRIATAGSLTRGRYRRRDGGAAAQRKIERSSFWTTGISVWTPRATNSHSYCRPSSFRRRLWCRSSSDEPTNPTSSRTRRGRLPAARPLLRSTLRSCRTKKQTTWWLPSRASSKVSTQRSLWRSAHHSLTSAVVRFMEGARRQAATRIAPATGGRGRGAIRRDTR